MTLGKISQTCFVFRNCYSSVSFRENPTEVPVNFCKAFLLHVLVGISQSQNICSPIIVALRLTNYEVHPCKGKHSVEAGGVALRLWELRVWKETVPSVQPVALQE